MNLYREEGLILFLDVCLCDPIPFLLWMYDLLKSTFELRGAVFIPGWIDNLAAPDVLFSWETPISSSETNSISSCFTRRFDVRSTKILNTGTFRSKQMTEAQRQQRAMGPL